MWLLHTSLHTSALLSAQSSVYMRLPFTLDFHVFALTPARLGGNAVEDESVDTERDRPREDLRRRSLQIDQKNTVVS